MASVDEDPAASTQQFRAYVEAGRAEEPRKRTGPGLVVTLVVLAVLVVGAIVVFALTR